jgi:hypothetical protein
VVLKNKWNLETLALLRKKIESDFKNGFSFAKETLNELFKFCQ